MLQSNTPSQSPSPKADSAFAFDSVSLSLSLRLRLGHQWKTILSVIRWLHHPSPKVACTG